MPYKEKQFNTDFRKYAKNILDDRTFVYELKITKKDYINFSRLAKHQKYALLACKENVGHYKIPDDTAHGARRPFDGFNLCGVEALVGVLFNKDDQQKEFFLIPIKEWKNAREEVDRKSLTREKASEIGERHELA